VHASVTDLLRFDQSQAAFALTVLAQEPVRGEVLPTILVLAAIAVGTALSIGSWVGRRLEVARTTIRQRAFALFWPHLVVLAVFRALDVFVLYAFALGRIH
jgi:hypothetical protein